MARNPYTILKRLPPTLLIFAAVAAAYLLGAFEPIERMLMDARFHQAARDASGELVVVEIDSRSLHELDSWPWPRGYHAEVLDRLFAAGASVIALDVDLSASAVPSGDDALTTALARADGKIILPAFAQLDHGSHVTYSFPLPRFRDRARIGAVNVFPGPDSLVRQYAREVTLDGATVATSPALLAGTEGEGSDIFYLDFGIRPESLPVLSYVDVLKGNFVAAAVAGKKVLVGASAIELGDQFAVPLHRTLAGPLLQAIAFESLSQGRALQRTGMIPTLALMGLVLAACGRASRSWGWRRQAVMPGLAVLVLYAASLAIQTATPISLDIAPPIAAAFLLYCVGVLHELERHAGAAATHRVSDARRRAMMQRVLEDSFDGVVISSADGAIELANPAAARILRHTPEAMVGKPVEQFLPGSSALTVPARRDVELRRGDGSVMTLEQVISSSHQPEDQLFIHTFRDISERKTTEDKLRAAMQEALAASRTKTEFLANMSHELRTPLNAIIGFSEMISAEMLGKLPDPRYRSYAADIVSSGRHLLDIINDILDISKIEAGRLALNEERVDLHEVIAKCVKFMQGRSAYETVDLRTDVAPDLPPIKADPRLIAQLVLNLLSNAVKFTPKGGTVLVSVTLEHDEVVARISDTGIGMPAQELAHVTKPFYQVEGGLARKHQGTGLGLALVSAFTKLHEARLEIESAVGKGTTVTVRFPPHRTLLAETQRLACA
jgi:PAS domain S-box-containing protein